MSWVRIASLSELLPGSLVQHEAEGRSAVVCNHGGELRAFHGLCPHRNGPLGQGNLADGRIVCPWHAWEFDCQTGEYDYNPAIRLDRYDVKVEGGDVFVDVP